MSCDGEKRTRLPREASVNQEKDKEVEKETADDNLRHFSLKETPTYKGTDTTEFFFKKETGKS